MLLAVCPNPSVDHYVQVASLEAGKVHRALGEQKFPGGKGVHVALAAAELGEEVNLLAFWGGASGQWIKSECQKRNIKCIGPELADWSRSCFTFKSEGIYDDTELLGCGPRLRKDDYDKFLYIFEEHVKDSKAVTLSGSWPVDAPPEGYADLIKMAHRFHKTVFLDATGQSFELGLHEKPFAIHLNYTESSNYSALAEILEILSFFKKYVELVAITAGKEGLFLGWKDSLIHAKVDLGKIYSAVGSGDCLTAGLAIGLINKLEPEDLAKLAVACGGANCLREDLGMLYKKDVDHLLDKITIDYL